jgi:PKD repeat protein
MKKIKHTCHRSGYAHKKPRHPAMPAGLRRPKPLATAHRKEGGTTEGSHYRGFFASLRSALNDVKNGMTVVFVLLLITTALPAYTQPNITVLEYYVDNDPGFGLATPITITTGSLVDIPLTMISAATLPTGFHTLGVRAKNALGVWGFAERRQFYIPAPVSITNPIPADINAMEYYIDVDPGYGAGIAIAVTTGSLVDLPNEIITASALPTGFHTLGIRTKNTDGVWGFAEKRQFYIPPTVTLTNPVPADIQTLEYFFDVDPGFGNATALTITSGQLIDINTLIPETLTTGFHFISIRAMNTDGTWGLSEKRPVYIPPAGTTGSTAADITKIEYYFDGADPGIGNATDLPITPGQIIDLNPVLVPTSPTLIDGPHYITFRAMNADNVWGMAEVDTFDILDDCTQPIAAFTPSLACAGQAVTFIDNSDSLQLDAKYRWYLNGDNIVDDTIAGNVSFTYPNPGTYVVALAIRQGTICLDSIATTIDILPLPVAVFSAAGTVVNQATTFTASASNVPAGAVWEWDFDNDGVIDDNSVGSSSYIYTAAGIYNPSLTIRDTLGCAVTVTNPVNISDTGGGAPPAVDFLATNGCVGNNISFIDLSQNLPTGSTYSWDFDGDGVADTTTPGPQNYAYTTAGTYDAKLIIDIGGSTIEAIHTIEVVDIPLADFSAVDACEASPMDFTDLSTNTDTTAVYMWDFDNDGVVDSNAKTNVSFTYTSAGSYIVSLTVSNGFGCTNEIVRQVTVIGMPVPDFDWDVVCTGETVSFNDLSSNVEPTATYSWDIDGDGIEDSANTGDISFTYASKGVYNPALTITNPAGCAITTTKTIEIFDRPEVALDVIARCYGQASQMLDLSQKVSPTASYYWDFDSDGNIDNNVAGSTTFTYATYSSYIVNLTIDNGGGCISSNEKLVVFSDAASPDFITNKTCEGEEVVFTDLSSALEPAAVYSWDFNGDGLEDAATPGSTTHTFTDAGTYNATLTIDNGGGCLAYKTIALDVTPPPAVDLGPDLNLCVEGVVTFDAGTGYSAYLWPDGSSNQTYTVDKVGSYEVRVQDAKGCFNTDTISVQLLGPPVPAFIHTIELSLDGIKVNFDNTSTNADTYSWSFGDGTTSADTSTTHTYSDFSFYETSVYEVCLIATNECDEAQICENIFVSPTQLMEEGGNEINVFPNPVNQRLNVEIGQDSEDINKIFLLDVSGKMVWQTSAPAHKFELVMSEFSRGTYYLILEQDNKFIFKRILKN